MKGNGNLCRTLVKAGACVGAMNNDGITIFNCQMATTQLLFRYIEFFPLLFYNSVFIIYFLFLLDCLIV